MATDNTKLGDQPSGGLDEELILETTYTQLTGKKVKVFVMAKVNKKELNDKIDQLGSQDPEMLALSGHTRNIPSASLGVTDENGITSEPTEPVSIPV